MFPPVNTPTSSAVAVPPARPACCSSGCPLRRQSVSGLGRADRPGLRRAGCHTLAHTTHRSGAGSGSSPHEAKKCPVCVKGQPTLETPGRSAKAAKRAPK